MANKFNIHWQIVRTEAKEIKDPEKKLQYVLKFLRAHDNAHNYDRVLNWVKMTGVAYKTKNKEAYEKFQNAAERLEKMESKFAGKESDMDNDLNKISLADLLKVYKDLKARKYGFQYKSVPVAHTKFLAKLEAEIKSRKDKS